MVKLFPLLFGVVTIEKEAFESLSIAVGQFLYNCLLLESFWDEASSSEN